jgi:hypothetical protein
MKMVRWELKSELEDFLYSEVVVGRFFIKVGGVVIKVEKPCLETG